MKVCSKCQRQLPETQFVKSGRYLDGLYPSCKECRKKVWQRLIDSTPLCCRCKVRPHCKTHQYCYECQREVRGDPPIPRFRRDVTNKTMCSKCKKLPRLPYSNYCRECLNISVRAFRKRHSNRPLPTDKRRKATARHYINGLLKHKKIKRKPCEVCGKPSQHFHHLDYHDRTTNVMHVCHPCHVQLEREKRRRLTERAAKVKEILTSVLN